ncbi:hypothetical protein M1O16_01455 [Dehalococcoidia bacterium]|nr:hypothetical protein [Dehalococcoidia bacterium]MCL0098514.1 hypothetical protein [Dehalococcoidia bacterium]
MTALTTMIGFGSLGFSPHRGLAGMGYVLVIGVAACLITAVFVLPLILAGKKDSRVSSLSEAGVTVHHGEHRDR